MSTILNPGEALKNKIKAATEPRVTEKYMLKELKEKQEETPLDYVEVLGLLLTPLFSNLEPFTLDNAISDITAATMEILSEKHRLEAAKSPTFTKTLGAIYTFLHRLQGLTGDNDHLYVLANLWLARRWDALTPSEKESLLEMYGAGDNGEFVPDEKMPTNS